MRFFHFGYPPPKGPPGRSMLIILALGSATLAKRKSVPPFSVPISKIAFGLSFATISKSLAIS